MRLLTVKEIEYVAHALAAKLLSYNEPIPGFSTRYPEVLESCLVTPFQVYAGKDVYPSFLQKAAMLFYLLIKNHPFKNGNKRIAVMTLLYFLSENNKWIKVDTHSLYNFAVWVAESPAGYKDHMVELIVSFLKKHVVDKTSKR
ncbi:MAG: hypothetical protein A2754_04245 [Candidatus Magasanikbacteria bacterium RIFCSPHIGHO2_01_FULL_47_8]|uniref:Fido domain-containing protein n=1 Tax=Candidatus Magasanikbacteria bacterium RIFCSPHIGHO2_01_FULL_47_8 TaxID=1798673 RepID=A0A1F6MDE2_9BACT|nr:MAG: hypothetical protein A2754_04245 [Candidatus Magasanikbacteria bacterium RIFCSPHIGHO2_01_FULL_47_8]